MTQITLSAYGRSVICQTLSTSKEGSAAAKRMGHELADFLAARHNIPSVVHALSSGAALVSIYTGLVARCDGSRVCWRVPDVGSGRTRPLVTYALKVETAAERLAAHYKRVRQVPLGMLLEEVPFLPSARAYLSGVGHAAAQT